MTTRPLDTKALIATLDVEIAKLQADDQHRRQELARYTANMTSIARQDKAGVDELIARADRQLAAARSARLPRRGRTAYVECPRCDTVVDVNGYCACHCYAD